MKHLYIKIDNEGYHIAIAEKGFTETQYGKLYKPVVLESACSLTDYGNRETQFLFMKDGGKYRVLVHHNPLTISSIQFDQISHIFEEMEADGLKFYYRAADYDGLKDFLVQHFIQRDVRTAFLPSVMQFEHLNGLIYIMIVIDNLYGYAGDFMVSAFSDQTLTSRKKGIYLDVEEIAEKINDEFSPVRSIALSDVNLYFLDSDYRQELTKSAALENYTILYDEKDFKVKANSAQIRVKAREHQGLKKLSQMASEFIPAYRKPWRIQVTGCARSLVTLLKSSSGMDSWLDVKIDNDTYMLPMRVKIVDGTLTAHLNLNWAEDDRIGKEALRVLIEDIIDPYLTKNSPL